jgi:glycosyltransferase involved in cell wall biosynthesis
MTDKRPINLMELRATYTTGGGPDKTVLLSAERHDRSIVNPVVVYLRDIRDDNFQIRGMAEGRGFRFIEVLDRGKIDFKSIIALNRIVRQYEIDIIHGHDYKTDMLAYILALINPSVHLVSTAHGWITNSLKSSVYKWLHLKVLKRFKNLIAVSEATKRLMVASGIHADRIEVIYNGIDEVFWSRPDNGETLKNELGLPEDSMTVGTVGRISDEKDYYTFLKVAKTVTDKMDRIYFVIVGEGKEKEKDELIRYADKLGVRSKVFFTGYRSDLLRVYSAFDIFLMTSVTEGLPNTMLEAMSMGIPVVSTDVGGIPELVVEGETGFLFDVGDVRGISEKIMALIRDRGLLESMSKAVRKRIEERFSFNMRLQVIENYYVSICSKESH